MNSSKNSPKYSIASLATILSSRMDKPPRLFTMSAILSPDGEETNLNQLSDGEYTELFIYLIL